MFRKFVLTTALLNIFFAPMLMIGAILKPVPEHFLLSFTTAGFFLMSMSLLIWAARNLKERAPVLFWNAMVRLIAVATILYAVPNGLVSSDQYVFVIFDGTVALLYILGAMRETGRSFLDFLLWRVA